MYSKIVHKFVIHPLPWEDKWEQRAISEIQNWEPGVKQQQKKKIEGVQRQIKRTSWEQDLAWRNACSDPYKPHPTSWASTQRGHAKKPATGIRYLLGLLRQLWLWPRFQADLTLCRNLHQEEGRQTAGNHPKPCIGKRTEREGDIRFASPQEQINWKFCPVRYLLHEEHSKGFRGLFSMH